MELFRMRKVVLVESYAAVLHLNDSAGHFCTYIYYMAVADIGRYIFLDIEHSGKFLYRLSFTGILKTNELLLGNGAPAKQFCNSSFHSLFLVRDLSRSFFIFVVLN